MTWYSNSRIIRILLFILVVPAIGYGADLPIYTITGQVLDYEFHQPLSGANVVLSGTNSGTMTDAEGYFTLQDIPPSCDLIISMMGYSAQRLKVTEENRSQLLKIYLQSYVHSAGDVVVFTASKDISPLSTIHRYLDMAPNVEDALASIEGVSLIARGAFGKEPVLRGLSGGQINLQVDGMRVFSACTDRMDPVTIYVDSDALGEAIIEKGAFNTENGSTIGGQLTCTMQSPFSPCYHQSLPVQVPAMAGQLIQEGSMGNSIIPQRKSV